MVPVARTFPRFGRLPKELRDQIWSYAANEPDRKPGVHFLSVSDHESWIAEDKDKDLVESLKRLLIADVVDGALPVRFYASARPNESSRRGGPRRNPSTYMTSQGMWAACLESRAAMTRKVPPRQADLTARHGHAYLGVSEERHAPGLGSASHTESSNRPAGNTAKLCFPVGNSSRCFEVLPQDLICVKTFDLARTFLDIRTPTYQGAEHVAWEFDPTMLRWVGDSYFNQLRSARPPKEELVDVHRNIPEAVTGGKPCFRRRDLPFDVSKAVAGAKAYLQRFWLIDYRLKRPAAPRHDRRRRECRKDRFVFYGNGCRFVEVQLGDTEWEYYGLPPASAAEATGSVFWIRRELEVAFWEFYRRDNGHDDGEAELSDAEYHPIEYWPEDGGYEFQDGGFEYGAITGVLACEDWE